MASSYNDISGPNGKLARLEPFTGNSMSAWGDVDDTSGYRVFSYQTEIARVIRHPDTGSFVAIHGDGKYSVTTSKQQTYCRAWLPGEMVMVPPARIGRLLTIPNDLKEPANV